MNLTSRRKRPIDRTIPYLHDTRLIIIATEGERTEKQYFDIFIRLRRNSHVQVTVFETVDGASAPIHVIARLKTIKKKFDFQKDDELWLVIDTDRWGDSQLSQVAAESLRCHFGLAVSRPCFELWLFLHHSDPSYDMEVMTCREIENALRTLLGGYDHSNIQIERFVSFIEDAIQRAIRLDTQPDVRWPHQLGTRVYLVVQSILNLRNP